jgi:hypothetical protein
MNLVSHKCRRWINPVKVQRRQLSILATALGALVALAGFGSPTAAFAQDVPYTEASLQGDYAFVGAYSGDVARLLGTAFLDGKGNLTSGSARVVIEGGTVKSITYSGQYTINPDGAGRMALTVFGVATPPPTVYLDFVTTKARFINGIKIATEVQDALEGSSVVVPGDNSFVTHVFTRRPDREDHHQR